MNCFDKKIIKIEHPNHHYKNWVRIEWNLGKRCNFDCSYCGSDLHDNYSSHVELHKVEKILCAIENKFVSQNKKIRLSITGGEPFVHPNIIEILRLIKIHQIHEISSITNGSLPLKKYEQAFDCGLSHLIFSWHYEFVRENQTLNTIKQLNQDLPGKIQIHLMFLPGYLEQTKKLIDIFKMEKIAFSIRRIRPLTNELGEVNLPGNSGYHFKGHQKIDRGNYYSQQEEDFLKNTQPTAKPNCLLTFEDGSTELVNVNEITANKLNLFKGWTCFAGSESLMIDNDQKIYRATCKQGGSIGYIDDLDVLNNLTDTIICNKYSCNCAADINITKYYTKKL